MFNLIPYLYTSIIEAKEVAIIEGFSRYGKKNSWLITSVEYIKITYVF